MTPPGHFVRRLRTDHPLVAVELRPPRRGLTRGGAMDTWIDLSHSVRRVVGHDTFLLLTDSAVGQREEENLQHLTVNVAGEVDPWRVVPFLTCKHPLEYCLRYGARARATGLEALTVVGGDRTGGPPRCVPHAYELRERLRTRSPDLALGGWVNPYRGVEDQLGYAMDPRFEADYILSQIVSHHDLDVVERWLSRGAEAGLRLPTAFGVFYYRNGKRSTLERLSSYFDVPVDAVDAAFAAGVAPERHCAETIVRLREAGAPHVYICNLGARHAAARYERILEEIEAIG